MSEVKNINNLDGTMIDADFVAVKIGDVNGNANATQARSAATLALGVEDVAVEAGEEYTLHSLQKLLTHTSSLWSSTDFS